MFLRAQGEGFRGTAFVVALFAGAGPGGALAPLPAEAQAGYSYQQPYADPAATPGDAKLQL